jgi:hypothetical protein
LKYWAAPATFALVVACVLLDVFGPGLGIVLAVVAAVFLASIVAGLVLVTVVVPVKERRELTAGYTSLQGQHREVDQLVPDSGIVIRRAGEPYLDLVSFRTEVVRARLLHSK